MPGRSSTQPAAISGRRLRDNVEADSAIEAASAADATGPCCITCDSSEYCVVFNPTTASAWS